MERQRAGRIARWGVIGVGVIGVGVILLGCGGDSGTGGGDAPDPTESNAAAPAVGALLSGASECVWVPVTECRSSIALGDWCGAGFYTATLQSCPDVGSTLSSVTAIYSSFRLGGCSPCVRHTMHVSVDAVECCPDGIPGTPVPDEADL